MKGNEFLKKLKALAERKGWPYEWHPDEGKGRRTLCEWTENHRAQFEG